MSNCTTNHSYFNCWRLGSDISVGVNIAIIVINVIHLMVILSISSLSGKVYKKILISQVVQDILVGIMHCLTLSCSVNRHMLLIRSGIQLPIVLIRNMLWEGLTTSRFSLFSVALAERYIAICKPLTYQGHFVKRHIGKLLMFSILVSLAYKAIFIFAYANEMCINNIVGPTHQNGGNLISYFMDICGPLIVSLILILFFAINIVRELKRSLDSSRQQGVHNERSDLRRATVYIMVTCVAYIILFAPILPCSVLYSLQPNNPTYIALAYACLTCEGVYGMINVAIFIGMHHHYYKRLWTSITCCQLLPSNRVNS